MSTILLDSNTLLHLNGSQTGSGIWSGTNAPSIWGLDNSASRLRIFKGSLPTKSDLNAVSNVSTFRTTDLLITFATGTNWTYSGVNAMLNTPVATAATSSGTASWFLLSSYESSAFLLLAGDITLPGGGGEIAISDLTITSGQTYSLGTLLFTLPKLYTYP